MTSTAATPPPGPAERFLLFSLGLGRFAVESRVVRGVVPIESFTPLPRAPGAIWGIFQHRGNVVPLLDVRDALGVGRAAFRSPVITLLLEVPPWSAGVVIDEVKGYEKLSVDGSATGPGHGSEPWRTGAFEHDGERYTVLDAGALLESLRVA